MPKWLAAGPPFEFNRENFFGGKTLFYPGARFDWQPLKFCAESHSVHSFVYVDLEVSCEEVLGRLNDRDNRREGGFRGYQVKHHKCLSKKRLWPRGWELDPRYSHRYRNNNDLPLSFENFGFGNAACSLFVVLERDCERDCSHGPGRLAFLYIGGICGMAMFDAIYCQQERYEKPDSPYLIVCDTISYGIGCQRGECLEEIALAYDRQPEWLLVGGFHTDRPEPNHEPWDGYQKVGARDEPGGFHDYDGETRRLFRRSSSV